MLKNNYLAFSKTEITSSVVLLVFENNTVAFVAVDSPVFTTSTFTKFLSVELGVLFWVAMRTNRIAFYRNRL